MLPSKSTDIAATIESSDTRELFYFVSDFSLKLPNECVMISSTSITDLIESPNLPGGFMINELVFKDNGEYGVIMVKMNNNIVTLGYVFNNVDQALLYFKGNITISETVLSINS